MEYGVRYRARAMFGLNFLAFHNASGQSFPFFADHNYRRPYMAWFAAVLVGLVDFHMIREDCAVKLVLNLLHAVQDRPRSAHCSITKEL